MPSNHCVFEQEKKKKKKKTERRFFHTEMKSSPVAHAGFNVENCGCAASNSGFSVSSLFSHSVRTLMDPLVKCILLE